MLQEYFESLTDPRQPRKVKHNLLEIVVMTICAIMAGCDVWEDIVDFCRVKMDWFQESLHMKLENGLPSHDTFQRVWGMIEPEEFEKCFCSWVQSICSGTESEIISVDGKTLRRSGGGKISPIHMVSAWANQNQLVLGQIATDAKSNEITAVPKLLEMLDIKGCIITADAMSCQKEITKKITEKEADYVISLKDNQPSLRQDTADYFEDALADPKSYPELQFTETKNKGHSRIECRKYYLTTKLDWLSGKDAWGNLNGLGMVRSKVEKSGEICEETRCYITSLGDVEAFAKAARAHWGVENSLHWCLDMTFREDYSRIRKDHSAENMAIVRHIALDILKKYPSKISLARKRRRCSYDDAFLADVLRSVHA
jgi:predicted transposase YbfD/YdcC